MLIRYTLLFAGWLNLALGLIGVFLPLVPTTPFILLAAFFFARSSEGLHAWLLSLKFAGPLIQNWEHHRVISLKAKLFATSMMMVLLFYPLLFGEFNPALKVLAACVVLAVLSFIWIQPSAIKSFQE